MERCGILSFQSVCSNSTSTSFFSPVLMFSMTEEFLTYILLEARSFNMDQSVIGFYNFVKVLFLEYGRASAMTDPLSTISTSVKFRRRGITAKALTKCP